MKVAGTVVIALGCVLGLGAAMVPISVTILGEKGSCGPPLLRVVAQQEVTSPELQRVIDLCEDRSADRLVPAGSLVFGGIVGGGGLLLAGRRRDLGDRSGRPAT